MPPEFPATEPDSDSIVPNKKKKSTSLIIFQAACIALGFTIGLPYGHYLYREWQTVSVHQKLIEASEEINKKLPMMVDNVTRLDSTRVGPDRTLIYHYTAVAGLPIEPVKLKVLLLPQFQEAYRTSTENDLFRRDGVSIDRQYFDTNGNFIMDIEVGPNDLRD
jgi:hypothetical protein